MYVCFHLFFTVFWFLKRYVFTKLRWVICYFVAIYVFSIEFTFSNLTSLETSNFHILFALLEIVIISSFQMQIILAVKKKINQRKLLEISEVWFLIFDC